MSYHTYNFCTLFDSFYIFKGLALYKSLEDVCDDFILYIMTFDEKCYNKLQELQLKKAVVCKLEDFETHELLEVKKTRTRAEYCWTCGPSVIDFFIDKYNLNSCTYLDSDLMFIKSPQIIFDEFKSNTSVAISEHFNNDTLAGKYCVQFMYFKNNNEGKKALKWWKEKCIEWCYSKFENGKYGDQKYLDDFPILFQNVHIIKNRGAGIAPWNMNLYKYQQKNNNLFYNKENYECIFFHFHGIKIERYTNTLILKAITYDIPNTVKEIFFLPYLKLISNIYFDYFNIEIQNYKIENRKKSERIYSYIKKKYRNNKIFQFLYYKILKIRYNGYESQKEI